MHKKLFRYPTSLDQRDRYAEIQQQARQKLEQFAVRRVIESKLSTKSFNFNFQFSELGASPTMVVRSLGRLWALLFNDLKKTVPYIVCRQDSTHFVDGPTTASSGSRNVSSVNYSLGSTTSTREFETPLDSEAAKETFVDERKKRVMERYCRKLNRKALAARIPVKIEFLTNVELRSPFTRVRDGEREGYFSSVTGRMTECIRFTFVNLQPLDEDDRVMGEPLGIHDSGFYVMGLRFSQDSARASRRRPEFVWPMESIFLYVDEIRQMFQTITRVFRYAPSAFVVLSE